MNHPAVPSRSERLLAATTRSAVEHPWLFLAIGFIVLALSCWHASHLQIRGSFVHLLPDRDPTAQRYQHTLDRKGGSGSSLYLVVKSPDAEANRRLIDHLHDQVAALPAGMVTTVERGPEEAREFFKSWRWLFADEGDLERIECELSQAREEVDPSWLALEDDCPKPDASGGDSGHSDSKGATTNASEGATANANATSAPAGASPLERFEAELKGRLAKVDRFPSGYYQNESGTLFVLRVLAPGAGMGEFGSDTLFQRVKRLIADTDLDSYHAQLEVGLAGSIPNAITERDALVDDIELVSSLAVGLILLSIIIFFRSPLVLLHIGLSMGTGTAIAFAAAMSAFGHLNAATSFLIAIVAGNGINHGIVYLARYREQRIAGLPLSGALVESALAVRRGTWLAALAAGGAFGCLMLTSFRGFSEFGLIGAVGMVACWLSTFLLLPASVSAVDGIARRLFPGRSTGAGSATGASTGVQEATAAAGASPLGSVFERTLGRAMQAASGFVSSLSARRPRTILAVAAVLAVVAAAPLPGYLSDPWEYNFARLGSKKSKDTGVGQWSREANKVFGVRGSPVLLLAEGMEESLALAQAVELKDRQLTQGKYIERTETIYDRLGGPPDVVAKKLEALSEIRAHIDAARGHLKGRDAEIAAEWRPPDGLRALRPEDLPRQLLEQFREKDGTLGTPVYAYLNRDISQSRGENILAIDRLLESLHSADGKTVPNASRATVFAAIIHSLERDAPRATLAALLLVIFITAGVTRRMLPAMAVIGALLAGILFTVGGAAWLNVRLNFLNFVAIPLTFGICVEYAINLYERVRVYDGDVTRGIRSAGGPVFLCSLTTILGYGSLLIADNRALQSFGKYAIAGEISCILTALLVMPAALHALQRRAKRGT